MLKSGFELTTAIVDLITGLVLIPFVFLIRKKEGNPTLKKYWFYFLLFMSLGNILGFVVHAFAWTTLQFDLWWIIVYIPMYMIVVFFTMITLFDFTKGKRPVKKDKYIIFSVATAFIIASIIQEFYTDNDILVYVIFAAIVGLPCIAYFVYNAFKHRDKAGLTMLIAAPILVVGLVFELTDIGTQSINLFGQVIEFNKHTIFHVILLACSVIFYFVAKADIKREITEN